MNILKNINLQNEIIDKLIYSGAKNNIVNHGELIIIFKSGKFLGIAPKYYSDGKVNKWIFEHDRNFEIENEDNKLISEKLIDLSAYENNPLFIIINDFENSRILYLNLTEKEITIKIDNTILLFKLITELKELENININIDFNKSLGQQLIKDYKINMLFTFEMF